MDEVTTKVARQYTAHAYPQPYDDLAAATAAGRIDMGDPSVYGALFWPGGAPAQGARILVAGCGTVQGAMIAFKNPQAQVVGVDLSEASLAHERFLRERHGLGNLELFQGDLRDVGKLDRRFDLIVSSGVLHHLADPGEGLRALRDVLAPGGAMMLMVYGEIGRAGVYPLQDMFRRMKLGQTADDIATVRRILSELPSTHVIRPFLARTDIQHDAELVDIFLHPQDVAYNVPGLLEWVAQNGMAFQGWAENYLYYPDALIPATTAESLGRLPVSEQWAVVETLHGGARTHSFILRLPGEAEIPDFEGQAWLNYRPTPMPGAGVDTPPDGPARLLVWSLAFPLDSARLSALRLIDGERSIGQILAHPTVESLTGTAGEAFARDFFGWLWRIGAVMIHMGRD